MNRPRKSSLWAVDYLIAKGLTVILLLVTLRATATAAEVFVDGLIHGQVRVENPTVSVTTSVGKACVRVATLATTNPGTSPTCTIGHPVNLTGRGFTVPKFTLSGGVLEPKTGSMWNVTESTVAGGVTTATGTAAWGAAYERFGDEAVFGGWHRASARVNSSNPTANLGSSVTNADGVIEFNTSGAARLYYTASVGSLSFKSDFGASNTFYASGSMEGVRFGGTAISGLLWALTIETNGPVATKEHVAVDLWILPALGISSEAEEVAEAVIRNKFQPIDGGVGFLEEISLFGSDGPLPAIELDQTDATVKLIDGVVAYSHGWSQTSLVPATTGWSLLAMTLGLITAALASLRLRRPLTLKPVRLDPGTGHRTQLRRPGY